MELIIRKETLEIIVNIHRFSHAHPVDIKEILRDVGKLTQESSKKCEEVRKTCPVCAQTDRPAQHRKVSLTHVKYEFNDEIQADFAIVNINGEKYEILIINDNGTRYGEITIATTRPADTIKTIFEASWIYRHGAPMRFSAYPEFCRSVHKTFLAQHGTMMLPRPSRSAHKNGLIERNNGVFRLILERV